MRLRQKLILISFESRSRLQNAVKRISLHVFNYSPFFEKNSHHSVSLGGPLGIMPKALANLCVFLIEFIFNVQTVIVTYGVFFLKKSNLNTSWKMDGLNYSSNGCKLRRLKDHAGDRRTWINSIYMVTRWHIIKILPLIQNSNLKYIHKNQWKF